MKKAVKVRGREEVVKRERLRDRETCKRFERKKKTNRYIKRERNLQITGIRVAEKQTEREREREAEPELQKEKV